MKPESTLNLNVTRKKNEISLIGKLSNLVSIEPTEKNFH